MNTKFQKVRSRFAVEVVERVKMPTLHQLAPNLSALHFNCMKVVVAMHMLREAIADGRLELGGLVTETSSGTFALGLALSGAALGVRVHIVGDPGIDPSLLQRLEVLGAAVDIVQPQSGYSLQKLRLQRLAEIRAAHPRSFWPNQYDSPDNRIAYHDPADWFTAQARHPIDFLVGAVGSGGSTGGFAEQLRAAGHPCQVIAVDTPGSVLFGHRDQPRLLRGLGNSILPGNVRHDIYEEVNWIPAGLAFSAARWFYANYSLDIGPTAGAALLVGRQLARQTPGAHILVLCADSGERYRQNVLATAWLRERDLLVDVPSATPTNVPYPSETFAGWTRMRWGRRTLKEVLQAKERAA